MDEGLSMDGNLLTVGGREFSELEREAGVGFGTPRTLFGVDDSSYLHGAAFGDDEVLRDEGLVERGSKVIACLGSIGAQSLV